MTVGIPPSMPFGSGAPVSRKDGLSNATAKVSSRPRWNERPRWQRLSVYSLLFVVAATLVAIPWWGPRALSRLDFFRVRRVEFQGVRFAKAPELVQRLKVDTTQSVWQPLDSLSARVADHPMIANVLVERDLPGTLRVIVTERIPVAFVQTRSGVRPADAKGTILPIDPATTALDLPVASGDSVVLGVLDGLRQNAPEIYARVTEARRVRDDELRFTLTGGVVGAAGPAMSSMLIVRTGPDVTVARFRDILPVEADLARNHLRAVELDLRFRDQVIARQP